MDGQVLPQQSNYRVVEKVVGMLSQEKHEAPPSILGYDHQANDEEVYY